MAFLQKLHSDIHSTPFKYERPSHYRGTKYACSNSFIEDKIYDCNLNNDRDQICIESWYLRLVPFLPRLHAYLVPNETTGIIAYLVPISLNSGLMGRVPTSVFWGKFDVFKSINYGKNNSHFPQHSFTNKKTQKIRIRPILLWINTGVIILNILMS